MAAKHVTVLLADDDAEDIELLEESLLDNNPDSKIVKTRSGMELISYLEGCTNKELPSMIILDYNMPMMSGDEVLAKLCDEPRYDLITKIVLSTSANRVHIDKCMDNGAIAYFVKPNTHEELLSLAKKILELPL